MFQDGLDELIQKAWHELPEIDEKIKNLKGNGEKMFALFEKCQDRFWLFKRQSLLLKDEQYAVELRNKGNENFKQKQYLEALYNYNESLCFSEPNSANISIVFANRSAVYFHLKYYKVCIENINLAIEYGYPANLMHKLTERRKICEKSLHLSKDKTHEIKLSYEVNEKIPCMVEGIQLMDDKQFGRGLVATKNFKVGDIVIKEKPFVMAISYENKRSFYFQCFWCLKTDYMSLIPCEESVCIMFCSETCYKENLKNGFKYEVQVMNKTFGAHERLIIEMRTIIKILTAFEDINSLKEFLQTNSEKKLTIFDINKNDIRSQIKAYLSLSINWDARPGQEQYLMLWQYTRLYYLFIECTDLKKLIKSKDDAVTVMDMMHKVLEICSVNAIVYDKVTKEENGNLMETGTSVGLLGSLVNHSCRPNVMSFGENFIGFITMRPIKRGEQLFMSYVNLHTNKPLSERQNALKKQYFFDCNCIACEYNYLTLDEMDPVGNIPYEIVKAIEDNTYSKDKKKIKEALKMCCKLLQKWDHEYPFYEICMVLEYFILCVKDLNPHNFLMLN